MLKENDTYACDGFLHFYIEAIRALEKGLKSDGKVYSVPSGYYVSTSAAEERQWCLFSASHMVCDNNMNTLGRIQLHCQISMRFGKTSDMLFLNDLNPIRLDAAVTHSTGIRLRFRQARIMDFGGARQAAGVRLLGL